MLRTTRLAALADSPAAFGSTLERELGFDDAEWNARARASSAGRQRTLLLAERTGTPAGATPIGLVGGFRDEAEPAGTGNPRAADVVHLVSMWTAPAARGVGVGAALVAVVLDWAAETGADRVELWVVRGNDVAQRLYERSGFTVTDDHQPHPNDPCASEVRMVRHLSRRAEVPPVS